MKIQKEMLFIFAVIFFISIISFVSADNNACILSINLVNQDPNPAIPDSYVDVVFQVSGVQNPNCAGISFELTPNYPFSLDANATSVKRLEGNTLTPYYSNVWNIPYTVRVDKDALEGTAELEARYSTTVNNYVTQRFPIKIQDSRTNFDAVIQEASGTQVSIAIANTGRSTANSVIVRIPQQDSFRAMGTDGQMVGNLASGDYTIVSFNIASAIQRNQTRARNFTATDTIQNPNLKFDIYYTDELGVRRIDNMQLPLSLASMNMTSGFASRQSSTTTSSSTRYIILIILIIVAIIIYKKYPQIKAYFDKKGSKNNQIVLPDWIKNDKRKK
ncbi:MAG: hypothetical protein NT076_05335 [Candidatus Pacearchaeota archaeon]|nr:hypothetical protein [Candidatus Pacearchaeota archaeon]